MRLKTDYSTGALPHSEHPMPQAARESWLCLNGDWDFYKLTGKGEKQNAGTITVPFSPETLNSGIAEGFVLQAGESLRYERVFLVDESLIKGLRCSILGR